MLSNSQAGPGRKVKQEQEEISRNHGTILLAHFIFPERLKIPLGLPKMRLKHELDEEEIVSHTAYHHIISLPTYSSLSAERDLGAVFVTS